MEKLVFENAASTINNMASELESIWNDIRTVYWEQLEGLITYWSGNNYNNFAKACNTVGDSLYKVFYDATINVCTELYGKVQAIATSEDVFVSSFNTPSIIECADLITNTDAGQVTYDQTNVTRIKEKVTSVMTVVASRVEDVQQSVRSLKNSWEGEQIDSLCESLGSACIKIETLVTSLSTTITTAIDTQDAGEDIRKAMDKIIETATDITEVAEDVVNQGVFAVTEQIEAAQKAAENTWIGLLDMGQKLLNSLK